MPFTPTAAPDSVALGQMGADYITNTNTHTGRWSVIQVIADATFNAVVQDSIFLNSAPTPYNFAGVVLTAGTVIYGNFTSIDLTSGTIIAYRAA